MNLVYKAANITEAHIIKGLLESNGIATHVGGFYLQGSVGLTPVSDFVNVHVSDDDLENAVAIISEYKTTNRQAQKKCQKKKTNTMFKKIVLVIIVTVLVIGAFTLATSL
jgi:hypothetical protein